MIVKLKTLKGDSFDLEIAPDWTLKKVKEVACASEQGTKASWELDGLKLIFQGKVLDNDKDVSSYGIAENDFMVVMAAKPKAKPAGPAEAAAAPASAPAAPTPAAADVPAQAAPAAPAPAPAPAPATQFSPEATASIDNLVEMGYDRSDVEAAMIAAFMNPDRAVQYLEEGLPTAAADAMEADDGEEEPAPSTWAELAGSASFRREIGAIRDQTQLQQVMTTWAYRPAP